MKKVFLTAFVAAAFAFGMTACNNNKTAEEPVDSTVAETEVCEHECNHECTDSLCAAEDCANCTKKGTDECCKKKAAEACCEHQEGCEHQCEHACQK